MSAPKFAALHIYQDWDRGDFEWFVAELDPVSGKPVRAAASGIEGSRAEAEAAQEKALKAIRDPAHKHAALGALQGLSTPPHYFCVCGFVRYEWPSGRVIEWHRPSPESADDAERVDIDERAALAKARGEG